MPSSFSPWPSVLSLRLSAWFYFEIASSRSHTPNPPNWVYPILTSRTNIVIDDSLIRKARKLTRLKTKREIVGRALELFVRSEERKGILRYFGRGIWKGNLKSLRRNRATAPASASTEL